MKLLKERCKKRKCKRPIFEEELLCKGHFKEKLRKEADKLWTQVLLNRNPKCEVCGKQAQQVHHFVPKSQSKTLRYDLENGISLCVGCHFKHHRIGDPKIAIEIMRNRDRDSEWFDQIHHKRYQLAKDTIGWYENNIKRLKEE